MPVLTEAELRIVAEVVTELAKYRGTAFDKTSKGTTFARAAMIDPAFKARLRARRLHTAHGQVRPGQHAGRHPLQGEMEPPVRSDAETDHRLTPRSTGRMWRPSQLILLAPLQRGFSLPRYLSAAPGTCWLWTALSETVLPTSGPTLTGGAFLEAHPPAPEPRALL